MVAGQGIAVGGGDWRGDSARQEQRHAMGNVAVMVVPAGVSGMLVGMMIAVVQRDIAERHMLVIAGNADPMLHVVDHAGGAGPREYQRQRDTKRRADPAKYRYSGRFHGRKLA
jgi:hypothetical protein